ncbi:Foot protein 1 variant 1 [Labeo rohita]|uniref:Foot protein 1 variant 1 n=1 Tax=Labeo rohita TaxID=84645 RepID=A0ABQ8LWK1_LABRO|nr:Foot protein 1 variant 1 [Labeo rohita]
MSLLRFVTHGLPHYTPDYTPHQPLHFLLSNQRLYKYPGLPVTPRRPLSDNVRRWIDPRLLRFTLVSLSIHLSAVVRPCLPLTMSLSRPYNKSLRMDPFVSRLTPYVTEYSATTGSSNFSSGRHAGMNTTKLLLALEQGTRTLEGYIQEFLDIAHYSDLPDCVLVDLFHEGMNQPLNSRLRREAPRSSLERFLDYVLLCVGSPFTVGVAEEERDNAVMAATHPADGMVAAPEREATDTFAAWIAREMAAVSERARAMAAKTELRHVTAAMPEPSHAGAVFPAPSQVSAALSKASEIKTVFPVSSQVRAVDTMSSQVTVVASVSSQITAINPEPEPLHKMAATPEPLHKMAATPEPLHKMAATPEPLHKMAATPEPLHKMAATPEPLHKMAATPEPLHKMAATPEPLHKMAATPEPLHKMAATPEPLHKMGRCTRWLPRACTR